MLAYALETMDRSPKIDRLVLVIRDEDRATAEALVATMDLTTPTTIVEGGDSRHQSERHGLESLSPEIDDGRVDIVAVHDGARPFMTTELLHATIEAARRSGGGVPGLPLDGPVYERADDGTTSALPQTRLRRMQTPQTFRAAPLLAAYRRAEVDRREGVDTAETAGRYTDLRIEVVPGDPRNIKVTFVEDIFQAEEYAGAFADGAWDD